MVCSKAEPLSVERWVSFANMEVTARSGLIIFRRIDLPSISGKIHLLKSAKRSFI